MQTTIWVKLLAVAVVEIFAFHRAQAATFNIPNGNVIALKNAINTANANGVPDTINLASNGTYTLMGVDNQGQDNPSDTVRGDNGLPVVRNDVAAANQVDLVINGNGATITPFGGGSYRFLHVRGGASCTVNNVRFYNANGYNGSADPNDEFHPSPGGGALFNDASDVTLTGCKFESNVMAADRATCPGGGGDALGGAIYNTGVLTATGCTFTDNGTDSGAGAPGPCYFGTHSWGGAIFSSTETINLSYCIFTNNYAHTRAENLGDPIVLGLGGAVMTAGGYFAYDTITGGSARRGAAFYFNYTNATVTDCTMSYNVAAEQGGAIDAGSSGSTVTLTSCNFNANTAGYRGGAIDCAASMTIADCSFDSNQTTLDEQYVENEGGGAIYYYGNSGYYYQDLKIANTRFANNRAGYNGSQDRTYGGAILFDMRNGSDDYSSTMLSDCTVSGNHARRGGGIYLLQRGLGPTTVTVRNSTVSVNTAIEEGGGIYSTNRSVDGTSAEFSRCTLNLINCTLSGNQLDPVYSGEGAGLLNGSNFTFTASVTVLTNCTLSANTATAGTAIANVCNIPNQGTGSASISLRNTILNAGTGGDNVFNSNTPTATITSLGHNISSDAAGGNTGTGPGGFLNAAADKRNTNPMLDPLAYNGGATQTHALHAGSPAINTGDTSAPAQDQRYYLRSGAPDIGAFEFNGPLAPMSAASRMTHGMSAFDIALPLSGSTGVECRSGGVSNNYQLVIKFPLPVTVQSAAVTSGTGSVIGLDNDTRGQLTLSLSGVTNAQKIVAKLSNVNDGAHTGNVTIPMGVLLGDTNGNGIVNSSDVSQTKLKSGQAIDVSNFREDVSVNGTINSSDVSTVKLKSGTALP